MNDSASRPHEMHSLAIENAFALFLRGVATYCLLFSILYWVRLIGVYDGPLWRFDMMPIYWQVAAVTLSVFFPFAAIGLWILSSWGSVVWFICAATEITMYAGFPDLFGSRPLIVVSHIVVALIYAAFRIVLHLKRRSAAQ